MTPATPAQEDRLPDSSPEDAEADAREFAEFLAGLDPVEAAAAGWQVRRQDGLSAEEEAQFQHWLAEAPAHRPAFDRLQGVWGRLDGLPAGDIAQLRAGVPGPQGTTLAGRPGAHGVQAGVPGGSQALPVLPAAPGPQPAAPGRRAWLPSLGWLVPRAAMAGTACAVLVGGWLGWDHWQRQPTFAKTYATARGQQLDVRLPDGSALKLDTATRAEVTLYRQRRELRLPEGQALFTVQAHAAQPFDVLAGPVRITVVGTRFAVRNTRTGLGADGVRIVVEEGRVRVSPAQAGGAPLPGDGSATATSPAASVELAAGQSIEADATGRLGPVAAQPPAGALLWSEGRVGFDRTPLAQALAEFERYGPTRLEIRDPAVAALRINGSFDLRQLGAFTRALPQVLPVRLIARDGATEIAAAP
jgi:transmembrane sensor